jgi:dTDP-4-dehydrorhamnose reductase
MNKINVALIGAQGFVGSALKTQLSNEKNLVLSCITRKNYDEHIGNDYDLVIDAACNSKKYLADNDPVHEASSSIIHKLKTLTEINSKFHIHISSVDVYEDLSIRNMTKEDSIISSSSSNYGAHKLAAEQLVKHYAQKWLIFRLSGMVGAEIRKNPVYDIINDIPIYINENSKYQFMSTKFVAKNILAIYKSKIKNQIYNFAGDGLISPTEIAKIFNKKLLVSDKSKTSEPRIVNIDCSKLSKIVTLEQTNDAISSFKDFIDNKD